MAIPNGECSGGYAEDGLGGGAAVCFMAGVCILQGEKSYWIVSSIGELIGRVGLGDIVSSLTYLSLF